MAKSKIFRTLFVCMLATSAAILAAKYAGTFLVVDKPHRADVIVVLSGDRDDERFQHALNLLRLGYAKELVLDAPDWIRYGRSDSDLAHDYISTVAPDRVLQLHVCSFSGDSTQLELRGVAGCLDGVASHATSALLVTSNFHTRRALSVARHTLPQYQWSVAAAPDEHFGAAWWRKREWAKTTLTEYQKLCWWLIVEQWSAHR